MSVVGLLLVLAATTSVAAFTAEEYLRDVKPLLTRKCAPCHGALKQGGGLRLDTVPLAIEGGGSGPAIVPGKPDESALIHRVTATDESERMPRESSALSAEEIALLRGWILAGVPAPTAEQPQQDPARHWSHVPPSRPVVPDANGFAHPVDAFLEWARAARGLQANPPAVKATQLRRLHLDLIGLAPTSEELAAFEADDSPLAYERVVDRLLDDPRHGERWGRHWMDVWRYSDWYGRRGVNEIRYGMRHIWRWRDWIVRSLNEDKGYDRMIVEMLAGDEAAPTDPGALAATGFIGRNWYKFDRNVWLFDTVERTSQAFLGLTMRCARCHDHKYDPVTQEEYYRFRAFFEPHDVRTDRLDARTETVKDNKKEPILKDGLSRVYDRHLATNTFLFRRGDDRQPDTSRPLEPRAPVALRGSPLSVRPVRLPVEAWYPALRPGLAQGAIELAEEKVAQAQAAVQKARSEREIASKEVATARSEQKAAPDESGRPFLEDSFAKLHPAEWKTLNGRWKQVGSRLVEEEVTSFATLVSLRDHPRNFRATLKYRTLQPGGYRSVGFSFDFVDKGNSQDVYTSTGDQRQSVQAFHRQGGKQFYPKPGIVPTPITLGEMTTLEVEARGQNLTIRLNGEHRLDYVMPVPRRNGKFALWVHNGSAEFHHLRIEELKPSLADLEARERDARHAVALAEMDVGIARAEADSLKARIAAERAVRSTLKAPGADALVRAAAQAEKLALGLAVEKDVLIARHHLQSVERGGVKESAMTDVRKKLAEAEVKLAKARAGAGNPGSNFSPVGEIYPATSTGRRLALARWIASPENPRTARVAVNHVWLRHFGKPLVASVDNFGLAGREPTHPELLDWLAMEFMESGWSMKRLHRLIVTSQAYRQSSATAGRAAAGTDPDNAFYWRAESRRLEAEVIRDGTLFSAGNLDPAMGGPELDPKLGQTSQRRSLYFRTTPDDRMTMLDLFDLANPNACYERKTSVVPQQSLALMNGGLALDQARLLARNLTDEHGSDAATDEAFVSAAFVRVLNRRPTQEELAAMVRFIRSRPDAEAQSAAFPAGGQSRVPPAGEPRQRARELLVHTLFNHNEFVTVR